MSGSVTTAMRKELTSSAPHDGQQHRRRDKRGGQRGEEPGEVGADPGDAGAQQRAPACAVDEAWVKKGQPAKRLVAQVYGHLSGGPVGEAFLGVT